MDMDRDKMYRAADLAYMILQENEERSIDPAKIRHKLQQLNRGWPVESE